MRKTFDIDLIKRAITDWGKVFVLLLDEAAVVVLVILVLWFLGIQIPLPITIAIAIVVGIFVFIIRREERAGLQGEIISL